MKGQKRINIEQKWIKGENPGISKKKRNPGGGENFSTRPDQPWGLPTLP
jgi:hypothetical protein